MMRLPSALLGLLVLGLVSACDSGGPSPEDVGSVYVFNYGQFGNDASGSITTYDPTTGLTGRLDRPGGLPQAAVVVEGNVYVLLNYSDSFTTGRGLVNVVSPSTGNVVRQFEVVTPRGLAVLNGIAYVSALFDGGEGGTFVGNGVTPINLATGEIGELIPTGPNPEAVVVANGRVFVANSGFGFGSTLSVLSGGAVTDTVDIGCAGPNEMVAVSDAEIWVVCTGRSDFDTGQVAAPGEVLVVDAQSLLVTERFTFDGELLGGAALGQDATYDPDRNEFYVLQSVPGGDAADTIYRFDVGGRRLVAGLEITGEDASGIGFGGGQLYVGRLNGLNPFSDVGSVSVHERDGTEAARFEAGIVPTAFAFIDADLVAQE